MKKRCFIDIEANQLQGRNLNYILECSAINDQGSFKFECNHQYDIKLKIQYLLNLMDKNYYRNIKIKEKEVYAKLISLSNEYDLFAYGNYDQVVLDDVAKRYKMKTVNLIDYSLEVCKLLDISDKNIPSVRSLRFALGIELENLIEHDSLCDAMVLYKIYNKLSSIDENDRDQLKKIIKLESLRPKLNILDSYSAYIESQINNDYKIFVLEYSVIPEQKEKYYINEELDEYIETIINHCQEQYVLSIYSNDGKLIETKSVVYNKLNATSKPSNAKKAIQDLSINFDNIIFICNKSTKAYFEDKINGKRIFRVVNCIPIKIYNHYKSIGMENISKIFKIFYDGQKFDKFVDYNLIIDIIGNSTNF